MTLTTLLFSSAMMRFPCGSRAADWGDPRPAAAPATVTMLKVEAAPLAQLGWASTRTEPALTTDATDIASAIDRGRRRAVRVCLPLPSLMLRLLLPLLRCLLPPKGRRNLTLRIGRRAQRSGPVLESATDAHGSRPPLHPKETDATGPSMDRPPYGHIRWSDGIRTT